MKYVVIGAGGTGGPIGGFLSRAGLDVTLIARGRHLQMMQEKGLRFETMEGDFTVPVKACRMEEYRERPDVIFVCVKGYSLNDTIPFIRRIADGHTVVIPVLNIYGTGGQLQEKLPGIPVTDGCIYIAAEIREPGVILMSGKIFRVVFGLRKGTDEMAKQAVWPVLEKVRDDLSLGNIVPVLSEHIERDALQKFSFVSPMAAAGAFYDLPAAAFQKEGVYRETFAMLVSEVKKLADAMSIGLPDAITDINLKIMDDLAPNATASMHRDLRSGKQSEVDGLVFEVVRLGEKYGVDTPVYRTMAEKFA